MKKPRYAGANHLRFAIVAIMAFFFLCGEVHAQAQTAIINPSGGTALDNNLRIEVRDDRILVRRKGVDQYNLDNSLPDEDKGLRTYFLLEQRFGPFQEKTPKYVTACEISDVYGDGSLGNPYKIVTLSSFQNLNSATYNITTVYTYVNGTSYYNIDFYISSNEEMLNGPVGAERGGQYFIHIYLSQRNWMGTEDCSTGFFSGETSIVFDQYLNQGIPDPALTIKSIVGYKRENASCASGPEGVNVFKTNAGFTSWFAGPTNSRDTKVNPGFLLSNNINGVPQAQGVAVHKAVFMDATAMEINHAIKRFAVGFDSTELKAVFVQDPNPPPGATHFPFGKATIELSDANPSGPEGDNTHVISNLTLKVSGARFNLPQLATVKVIPTTSGVNDAVAGTDYEVLYTKVLIPPGDYTFVPGNFPLSNILIKGDDDLDPNKTFRVELTNDCSPHLQLGTVTDVVYTIEDDDANELFIEPAQTTLEEGKTMKVKVRMSGTPLLTDVVVTLAKGTADAESTDHSVIPPTVTIPAGSLFYEFDFDAIADRILEPATESLDITATATISGINRTHTTTISIIDTTGLNPDNKIISFTSPAATEGNNATITASLPAGVTTELPIVISMTVDPSSTTDPTDFGVPFPLAMTIPAAGNNVGFTLPVATDTKLEVQESLVYNGASTGFVVNSGQLDVIQEAVSFTVEFNNPAETAVTEPAYPQIVVRLPYATDFAFDVELQIDPTSTVGTADYYYPDPADFKVHFSPGMDYATFDLFEILPDAFLEAQEKLVIKASSPGFTAATGTLLINDLNSTTPTPNLLYFLETANGEIDFTEGETLQLKITALGDLSSEPITFTIGTDNIDPNINGADFELPLTVTLPAFATEVFFDVKAKTDAFTETDEELVITANADIFGIPYSISSLYLMIKDGINPVIEFTTSDVTEGGTVTVTAKLQSGVALSDIVITPERVSGSAIDDDIVLPPTVTILAGTDTRTFTLSAVDDGILERLETLDLGGTASGYIISPVTLNVIDANSAISSNKNITLTPVTTDVTEGSSVKVWVRLPAGITTSEELSIDLTASAATLLGTEYTFPANVKIPVDGHEISFDLVANPDNVLEPDEQLDITASARIFDEDKTATTQITIKDATGTAANKTITVGDPVSVAEGNTASYVFSLPAGITTQDPLVIQLTPGVGTDAAAADFVGNVYPATVTILANGNTRTLSVQPKADGIIENQEKLILVPSSLGYTFTKDVDLDIVDNDLAGATIVLSAASANVAEGSSVRITATLQGGLVSSTPINIVLAKDGASVAGATDHGALGTITIAAGAADGFVDISASNDLILENTESLILNGTATGFTVTGTTVNITDATGTSANKQLTLTPDATTVAEGGSIQVKVSLPTGITTADAQTINLTSGTGTAATLLGSEYTLPATVTIPAGGNEVTFTLTANTDLIIEPNETLEIKANATIYGEAVTTSSNVAITDVTASKLITITGATSVTEGSSATVTFSLPAGVTTAEALDIDLAFAGTSTALAADFTGVFPTQVTIPANGDHIDLTLTAKTDGVIEALEKLELIPGATGGFTFNKNVELDVVDNDLAGASILLSTSAPNVVEGGSAVITATLQGGLTAGSDLVVTLSKAGTSAAANDEHNALTTITILNGQSSGTFTLNTNTDDLLEPSENLDIEGSAAGFTVIPVTVNITDLNGQNSNNKIFTITPVAASVAEGASTIVKISLPSPHKTQDALTITLSRGALSSASLQTSEYSDFTGTVVIPAGGSEVTFNLDALTDNIIEPTEQLQLEASAMVYGTSITAKTTVSITDVTASKLITITGATSVTEGSSATVTFSLPAGVTTAEALDINLAFAGTSTALAADFNGVFPIQVTIPANGDHIDLTLTASADGVIEALEKLELIPSATAGFTFNKNVELDVVDNDATGATIILSAASTNVVEGGTVRITATLQGGLVSSTAINIVLAKDGASIAGATDHGALGTITIAAGAADGFIDISASNDLILENTESLILNGTATGFTVTGTTVNITDATDTSANKQLTITPDATTVAEGGSIQVKISLPTGITTADAQTINLTSGTGTVATLSGAEYTLPATVTIPAGGNEVTFTLNANTDLIIEPNETLEIKADATIYGEAVTTSSNVAITDVTASKLITITGATSVTEGSSATVTFSLPAGVTTAEALDIDLAFAGTSTALAADFTGVFPTKVTIPANGDHIDLTLTASADGVIEALEKLELIPSATGGFTFNKNVELDVVDNDATGAAIVLSAASTNVAEGGTVRITATLQGGLVSSTPINIVLAKDGASIAGATDHGALGTITIAANAADGFVDISASNDLILENTESLILNGTATGFTVTGTTVNITDATGISANKQLTLTPDAATVAEGGSIQVKISLPTGITTADAQTINLMSGTGTAATLLGSEYTLPATVTIPAGGNEVTFTLTANTDLIIEPNETLEIKADATIYGEAVTTSSNVAITDVTASKLITITGAATVTEGNSTVITFSLPAGVTTAEAIEINLAPGTNIPAVVAADLNGGIPDKVIIPAGGNDITLTIQANTDGVIETVEKLHLIPSAAGGFTFSQDVLLDVLDENHSGTITLTSNTASILEANGVATITVSLPGALTAGSDIQVNITKGSSTAGLSDHSALPASVTIATGQHETTFTVSAPLDLILEGNETLVLEGNAIGYGVSGTTIQIEDSTHKDPLNTVISLHPNGGNIAEGTTEHFYVSLPLNVTSTTPIMVQLAKAGGSSTAADTDHTNIPASITIPANSNASANFDISAVMDGIIEPVETVQVDGVVPAGFTFAGTGINITDATGLTLANRQIQIAIDSSTLHEGNTSKVTFALPAGITSATDILINVHAYSGFSATSADFTLTPATVILPKDMTTVTVVLEAVADNTDEPDEQLKLTGTATGFTVLHSNVITIPGSGAPAVTVTAVKTTDAAEPSTQGVFTIKLPGSTAAPADITVNYTVTGTAVSNEDYEPLSGTVTIKAGDNSVTVPAIVKDDQIIEGDETLQLTLQSASFVYFGNTIAAGVDNTGGAGMLILDDENIVEGRKILIEKVSDATEPSGNGSVRIRFADAQLTATVPVTVTYTVSGTATAGVDYNTLSGTATIPAGQHDVIVNIVPVDDTDLEGTETIIIELTGASAGLPLATQQQATVNLADNDMMTVEISAPASVAEGAAIPVKVRASQITPADMPVTISLQHDAFRTVTTSATFTVTIPANQQEATLNVVLDDNAINDDDGFVNLAIQPFAGIGQPYGIGSQSTAATVVTDNDPLEISFKVDTARVKEGNSAITPLGFTVKLNRMSSRVINLNYQFADAFEGAGADKDPMRARAGEDFQSHITSLAIAPMQLEAEIVVPVIGDVDAEIDQLFAIRLTMATVASSQNVPAVVNPLIAVGVIENDDKPIDMEIKVNKGLSPNGDGKNDVLFIENLDRYVQNEIVIVNRWGGTIYKTSNYNNQSNNFSGRSNTGGGSGSNLPDGSYFYVLHVWDSNGNMTRHTGYIVLKR